MLCQLLFLASFAASSLNVLKDNCILIRKAHQDMMNYKMEEHTKMASYMWLFHSFFYFLDWNIDK